MLVEKSNSSQDAKYPLDGRRLTVRAYNHHHRVSHKIYKSMICQGVSRADLSMPILPIFHSISPYVSTKIV